jgi:Holliday junction resolvase RusA-like endonuclease
MSKQLVFMVEGKPEPQGSMRVVGKFVKADNPAMKPWRYWVGYKALEARAAVGVHEIMFGRHVPVRLNVTFYFTQPKKHRDAPAVKPDIDKLCRAVMDALTGVIWNDDGQVVELTARKAYFSYAHASITVEEALR